MLMTIRDACAYIAIQRTTFYKLRNAGELASVKIGSRTLVTKESVDALIARAINAAEAIRAR